MIVKASHPILRRSAAPIAETEIKSAKTRRLISEMKKILANAPDGVGLAAPQVGVPLRIFLVSSEATQLNANPRMDVPRSEGRDGGLKGLATNATNKKEWEYFVFINPVLKKQSRAKTVMAEGCLSLPGKFGEVARAEKVFLEWHDERGKKHSRGFTKFFARVVQHEIDHLDGVLITDRARRLFAVPREAKHNELHA